MAFQTAQCDLSFDLGRVGGEGLLSGSCYFVEGIFAEGSSALRPLSIGQLVMALCLARATELEAEIVETANTLESSTEKLENLAEIENAIVGAEEGAAIDLKARRLSSGVTYHAYLTQSAYGISLPSVPDRADSSSGDLISEIESRMDSLNSFSQQTMIDIQAKVNKRDQSYDMLTNILKSLYTTLSTNAGNL